MRSSFLRDAFDPGPTHESVNIKDGRIPMRTTPQVLLLLLMVLVAQVSDASKVLPPSQNIHL